MLYSGNVFWNWNLYWAVYVFLSCGNTSRKTPYERTELKRCKKIRRGHNSRHNRKADGIVDRFLITFSPRWVAGKSSLCFAGNVSIYLAWSSWQGRHSPAVCVSWQLWVNNWLFSSINNVNNDLIHKGFVITENTTLGCRGIVWHSKICKYVTIANVFLYLFCNSATFEGFSWKNLLPHNFRFNTFC